MTPDWENKEFGVQLYCRDCLDVLPTLEDGSVDAVVTDPPYGVKCASWDTNMPPQNILSHCLRVASNSVLWFGAALHILRFSLYSPIPDRVLVWAPSFALGRCQSKGFVYSWHPIVVWRPKKCGVDYSLDVMRHPCDGRNWWYHPGTKPISLMYLLVSMLSDHRVLDPFMGSGTTGVASVLLGRKFVGIEKDSKYFEICIKRIEDAIEQRKILNEKIALIPKRYANDYIH